MRIHHKSSRDGFSQFLSEARFDHLPLEKFQSSAECMCFNSCQICTQKPLQPFALERVVISQSTVTLSTVRSITGGGGNYYLCSCVIQGCLIARFSKIAEDSMGSWGLKVNLSLWEHNYIKGRRCSTKEPFPSPHNGSSKTSGRCALYVQRGAGAHMGSSGARGGQAYFKDSPVWSGKLVLKLSNTSGGQRCFALLICMM